MINIEDLLSEEEIKDVKNRVVEEAVKDISDYIRQVVVSEIENLVYEEIHKLDIKQLVKDTVTDSVNMNALGLAIHESQKIIRDRVSAQASAIIKACFDSKE